MFNFEESLDNRIVRYAKIAEKDGLVCNLTTDFLKTIMTDRCPIMGLKIDWNSGTLSYNRHPRLVRIDADGDFVEGNVVWICQVALSIRSKFKALENGNLKIIY